MIMRWLAVGFLVALDQFSKYLCVQYLSYHQVLAIFPSVNLFLTYNRGGAFSFLSQAGGWQRWFFSILTMIICVFIIVWLRYYTSGRKWLSIGLVLVLSGAIGNLIDRFLHGYVIDFIQVYYANLYWPTFNIADSAISIGVVMLLIDSMQTQNNTQ